MTQSENQFRLQDDKIASFLDKCYASGIKDPVRFLTDKMPRLFGFLRGAFPRGILPTDIDGEVELNGHFLRMEFKHESALRQGRIPKGQLMCFQALVSTGRFTVLLIGHDDAGVVTCVEIRGRRGTQQLMDIDQGELFQICQKWSEYVTRQPRPTDISTQIKKSSHQ